ncbi:MAG: T9SS type A sorting domain-containing protein, partial [Bacteroidota bacterium]|nr:T9SS type A sorting domain-containing protein [Bacteroidota bacterium]
INSSAKEIVSGGIIGLKGTAILNARVKSGDRWSALASVKFTEINEDYTNLKVTELHYHPTDSLVGTEIISGQSFEFIELKNTGDTPIKLSGLKFTSAIEYEFKETDVLALKQFYVIASKPKWFYERHFMVPTGNFAKNFANSGEQVTISNSAGNPVIDFTYYDSNPWPKAADGDGFSLSTIIRNPTGNPADPAYWTISSIMHGTPFADDPGIIDTTDDLPVSGNSVSVYPNPTKGLLFLKVDNENSGVQVKIHSVSGSVIFQSVIVGNSVIDLALLNIRSGIYLVHTKCNDKNAVHKVIYQPY